MITGLASLPRSFLLVVSSGQTAFFRFSLLWLKNKENEKSGLAAVKNLYLLYCIIYNCNI